jgi:hypothetical protein
MSTDSGKKTTESDPDMAMERIQLWFKSYYDKLAAIFILLALLFSLFFLAMHVGLLKREYAQFERQQAALTPAHPQPPPPDLAVFEDGTQRRQAPFQVADWTKTNQVMVPELRVNCIHCDRPIPYAAMTCPFCRFVQPEIVGLSLDRDKDGMLNEWEIQYGLNPLDPSDAAGDLDADGFTNLEEFNFKTKPNEPQDRPPWTAKLYLTKIKPLKFALVFKAVSTLSDHRLMFQLNLRDGDKTLFKTLGEEADGFKLVSFDKENSVLVLQRGEKTIPLVKGQRNPRTEFEITVLFDVENRPITLRTDSEFVLRDGKFKVKEIDSERKLVLIIDLLTGREVWIGERQSAVQEAGPAAAP